MPQSTTPATRHIWSTAEDDYMLQHYPHRKSAEIARLIGVSISAVYGRANYLGIKKSAAFFSSAEAHRLDGVIGTSTRFQPGNVPWNKGTKGIHLGGVGTQFKPGQSPHNTQPIGAYRISPDGSLQKKISNAKGGNHKRWRGVHELVWIAANGPVPDKHIVVFKPGMATAALEAITTDRVECITRRELMARNTIHTKHKAIAQLCQLKGAITRQVNRIAREQNKQTEPQKATA